MLEGIKYLINLIFMWWKYIPPGLVAIYIVLRFVLQFVFFGMNIALMNLGKTLLSSEMAIHEKVSLAISNSPDYNFFGLIDIIVSLLVLFYIISFLVKIIYSMTGGAQFGSVIMALVIFALIEVVALKFIDGNFGFIPLKDGIFYLLFNLRPVVENSGFLFSSFTNWVVSGNFSTKWS